MSEQEPASFEWVEGGGPLGETARCYVPADYQGPCAMTYSSDGREYWAVFPSREIAISAAAGACRYDVGGYSDVSIYAVGTAQSGLSSYAGAIEWLFEGQYFEDEPVDQTGVAWIVRSFARQLARRIAAEPQELSFVEWRDLERLLFEVFEGLGFGATLTRPGKDGGYDIRLDADGKVYFVEVKHWSEPSKVGQGFVSRFTEIAVANGGQGLLLSSSGFAAEVMRGRLAFTTYPVVLGDKVKVISLCRHYVKTEAGIWIRERSPGEIFFEDAY